MKNTDFRFIQSVVDEVFEPQKDWVLDPSRKRSVLEPRQVAHWVMYYFTKHALKDIGFYFGRRDHPVVINSVGIVNGRLQIEYEFSCKIRTIIDYVCLNGFKLEYKYGRSILEQRKQTLRFVTNYAPKPKQRKVSFGIRPNLKETLINDRNKFIAEYGTLQHKKRRIARTRDLDKVIELAKEISVLESSVKAIIRRVI